jgi:hypothetical protein
MSIQLQQKMHYPIKAILNSRFSIPDRFESAIANYMGCRCGKYPGLNLPNDVDWVEVVVHRKLPIYYRIMLIFISFYFYSNSQNVSIIRASGVKTYNADEQECHAKRRSLMPAIKIRDDEYATMWYYPESKILHNQVHQFFFGQTYRDVFSAGIQVFQKYGAQKWLSDDRKVTAWAKEDVEWGNKDWFPRMLNLGWKYWALILPEKVVGQMILKKFAENYSSLGVQTKVFSSVDEAKNWLEGCK